MYRFLATLTAVLLAAGPCPAQSKKDLQTIRRAERQALEEQEGLVTGDVEATDLKAFTLKVKMPKSGTVITFAWNKETRVYRDGQASTVEKIEKGQQVRVVFDLETNRARDLMLFIENSPRFARNNYKHTEPKKAEAPRELRLGEGLPAAGPAKKKPASVERVKVADEDAAAASLKLLRELAKDKPDLAKVRLQKLLTKYPGTKAAVEAKKLLEELGD